MKVLMLLLLLVLGCVNGIDLCGQKICEYCSEILHRSANGKVINST